MITKRIDELGRIVIPKEIRTRLRVKEGDILSLEIINNNIVIKKTTINNFKEISDILLDTLYKYFKYEIMITDKMHVISYIGKNKSKFINKEISQKVLNKIINREEEITNGKLEITKENIINSDYIFNTFIKGGDEIGSLIMYAENINKDALKIVEIGSNFLINYLET